MENTQRALYRHGPTLFLLSMISGFLIPFVQSPGMALSSHVIGVTGGAFILGIGAAWPHMRFGPRTAALAYWTLLYSLYFNWLSTLLGGIWGVGAGLMPMAADGHDNGGWQDAVVAFGLITISITSVITAILLIYGLRGKAQPN